MTQRDELLATLKTGCRITALDALKWFGCFRLAARIWELREMGYNIIDKDVKTPGGAVVSEYHLIDQLELSLAVERHGGGTNAAARRPVPSTVEHVPVRHLSCSHPRKQLKWAKVTDSLKMDKDSQDERICKHA